MVDRIIPTSDTNLATDNSASLAYEASRLVKPTPGVLFGLHGYNSGAAQFLQIHDAAALPANGVAPLLTIAVGATSNFNLDLGAYGLACRAGIVICNSTTGPTKTLGAADCWILARFK